MKKMMVATAVDDILTKKNYLLFQNFLSNIKRNDKSNVKFIEMFLFANMSPHNYMFRKSIAIK